MISDYGKQLKAFFHFTFKHIFEIEFGGRVVVEILILVSIMYFLLNNICKITRKAIIFVTFMYCELFMPLRVRMYEKLAFSTSNPNWQERADEIKDAFKKRKSECKITNKQKNHTGWWIFIYIFLITWVIGFHYFGESKRNNYEVFFLGENAILEMEDWVTNIVFSTDENVIPCFYHDKIE